MICFGSHDGFFIAVFQVRHQSEEQGLGTYAVEVTVMVVLEHQNSSFSWQIGEVFDQELGSHVDGIEPEQARA